MASNPSQPEDPKKLDQKSEKHEDQLTNTLDGDIDFWNLDSNSKEINQISDDLEDFLTIPEKSKPLSEQTTSPLELEDIGGAEIIRNLEKANSKELDASVKALSDEYLDEYQAQEREEQEQVVTQLKEKKELNKQRSLTEKISTIFCILFLIGLAVFCYNYYMDHFDIKTEEEWVTNIPVTGDYADLTSVETWWAEPVGQVKLGVKLVPTIKITLGEETKSGALRVIFFSFAKGLNDKKRAKGDPIPLAFKDGKFSNGKKTITIQCTDGLSSIAHFNAYRNQNITPDKINEPQKRWTVLIKEASSINTSNLDYKELGHAPIAPLRTELRSEKSTKK